MPLPRKQPQSPFSMLCWKFSGLPVVLAGGEPAAFCTSEKPAIAERLEE